jgi:acetolactate synthase-1/2/3 large subunit/sulfoacetaldehyde acetyltransferase
VFHELRQIMPRYAVVTLDAGTMCLQATDQLRYYQAPGLITPLDFGLVGFSYAAGIGAKAAAPDRPVVTLMGDGGFAMTMAEITTAVQHDIATVAVVLDNGCWGAEKAYQRDFYNGRYIGADVLSPAYDQVAKLCGAEGYAASKPGELAAAVEAALASGRPAVVHAKVDPNAIVSFRRDSFKHRGG